MTDRASEIIARIVRLKHGPNGTGRDGPCDPDCTKCALEKELEAVKADCAADVDNLHEQLHSGQVVIDGEPKRWRTVARFDDTDTLWLTNEEWIPEYPISMWQAVGESIDVLRGAQPRLAKLLKARASDSDLTACEEQRDVYRDRAQQLARRVTELEAQILDTRCLLLGALDEAGIRHEERVTDCAARVLANFVATRTAFRSLIARVRRTGGYASPEEQAVLWEAERVVGGDMGGVDGDLTRQTNAE